LPQSSSGVAVAKGPDLKFRFRPHSTLGLVARRRAASRDFPARTARQLRFEEGAAIEPTARRGLLDCGSNSRENDAKRTYGS